MLKLSTIAFCLVSSFLAACSASPAAGPTPTPVERATEAPQQRPTAVETSTGRDLPLEADVLAIYHKSGGIAGIDETLTVHQGGLVELTGGRASGSVKLDEPMLQPLRRMLESQEFADLAPLYPASGADLFTYSISARDRNGNMKTVVAMDGAKYPDILGLLIAMLNQIRALIK